MYDGAPAVIRFLRVLIFCLLSDGRTIMPVVHGKIGIVSSPKLDPSCNRCFEAVCWLQPLGIFMFGAAMATKVVFLCLPGGPVVTCATFVEGPSISGLPGVREFIETFIVTFDQWAFQFEIERIH